MKATVAMLFLLFSFSAFTQKADIIFINGKIFTGEAENHFVEAIVISGDKISYAGNSQQAKAFADSKTRLINLQGKIMVPGFNDQHDHPAFEKDPAPWGFQFNEFNVPGLSKWSVLDSISRLVKLAQPGQWITGVIGTQVLFDSSMRKSLDSLAPHNPVLLKIWWGHGSVMNSLALQRAGLSDHSQDPLGGWYMRNDEGKIYAAQENAQVPFWWALAKDNPEGLKRILEEFSWQQAKGGITTTLYFGTGFPYPIAREVFTKSKIVQHIRIVPWIRSDENKRFTGEWPVREVKIAKDVVVSGAKYAVDGTSLERNSLRRNPYHNMGNGNGRLNYPESELKKILQESLQEKKQTFLHITGDSSFLVVMKLIRQLGSAAQWREVRLRFEHNDVGDPSPDMRKMLKDYGIIMMHTPKYCVHSPIQSLLKDGIMVGISPDGTANPMFELFMITSQQKKTEENLRIGQAVIAFTRTNAYAEYREKIKGTLTKGMLADLVVLSDDIFQLPPERLLQVKPILTMIAGKIVFEE